MGVYFLSVEEHAREGRGEIEGCVGGVVGCEDEGVGELGGGEVGGEEGLIVDVGGVFFSCHCEGGGGLAGRGIGLWEGG